MKKEKKNADKMKDEPSDVIDFINNCLTKKPVRKAKAAAADDEDAGDAADAGAATKAPKAAKAPKPPKECPEGKVLNPKTGRCIKQKDRDAKFSF